MTPAQRNVVITLGFCGLVSAADNWFVSPALPAIAQALAIAPSAAAVILTAYLVPYGLLQPLCGAVGDAVGRVRLLRIIVAGLATSTVICSIAPTLEALVAARIITGCFAAGIITVSQAIVGSVVSEQDRQGAIGLLMGITFTGQGLSAGLGGIICDLVGWRVAFVCFGILGALAWLGTMRLRKPGKQPEGGSSAPAEPFRPAEFFSNAARIFFGHGRAVYMTACSTGIIFLGVYGFMGTFLAERCGLASTQAGLLMMFYGLACLTGGSVSGRIGAARGSRGVIAVGETSGIAACALLCASALTGSWIAALGAAACLGFGYILVQPTLVTLSMDIDSRHSGLCTGLIGLGVFAGGGVGSVVGGALIGTSGYLTLWIAAGLALACQALFAAKALPRG